MLYRLGFTADHHAIAAIDSPYAAACSYVDIVNALRLQFIRAANVVHIMRVASIDHDIAVLQAAGEFMKRALNYGRGDHQPNSTRRLQLGDEIIERSGAGRPLSH